MEAFINAFMGKKFAVYYPTLIVSTTATLLNLVSLLEEGSLSRGDDGATSPNDVIPSYIV